MAGNNIFISTTTFAEYDSTPLEMLKRAGVEVHLNPHRRILIAEELVKLAAEVEGLIAGTESLDKDTLKKLKHLRVISRCGAGLDNVDLQAAEELGIKIYSTPDAPTKAVAELTLGLMLNCLRRISRADRSIRKGKWDKPMGELLNGRTVGIIGYGRIGKVVSKLVQALGAKVLAYDIAPISETAGAQLVSFNELFANSDIITLHISADKAKGYLINSDAIGKMKRGAYLINTSRGELVDENALYNALKSGKLAGAGVDVFEKEPYTGKLVELDNAVLTSHIGSYAKEARIEMEKQAVENLLKGLEVKL